MLCIFIGYDSLSNFFKTFIKDKANNELLESATVSDTGPLLPEARTDRAL